MEEYNEKEFRRLYEELEYMRQKIHYLKMDYKHQSQNQNQWKLLIGIIAFLLTGSLTFVALKKDSPPVTINQCCPQEAEVASHETGETIEPMHFASVGAFTATYDKGNKLSPTVHDKAYKLFTAADWQGLQRLFTLQGANGGWPPNNGFIRIDTMTLTAGTQIDRYGGWYVKNSPTDSTFTDKGTFASPSGNSFNSRALQQYKTSAYYRQYTVKKNIPNVQVGEAIPWFGFEGMGLQFNLPQPISTLLQDGSIVAN